jgi:hypothetical protein
MGWRVYEQFETGHNSQAPSRICAVHKSTAVSRAEIDPVLALQASRGHNNAGVCDIGSIGADRVLAGWTIIRLRTDRVETNKGHQ